MQRSRYTALSFTLAPQPVPGQREIRFRPARLTGFKRPREVHPRV